MDGLNAQLVAGMFILAWLEAQPALPTLKAPSVALFYVLGRGEQRRHGIDVQVRPLAARAGTLMTALEKGPFALEGHTAKLPCLHLCSSADCVTHDHGEL